jgi:hypothetical protein
MPDTRHSIGNRPQDLIEPDDVCKTDFGRIKVEGGESFLLFLLASLRVIGVLAEPVQDDDLGYS